MTKITIQCCAALLSGLFIVACGGGGGGSSSGAPTAVPNSRAAPVPDGVVATDAFKSTAQFADELQRCTYLGGNTEVCTLEELPFLGQTITNPTISNILDRTLVSHTWMGDNFKSLLELMPADLLEMFQSVTAVVIASDIRPAFYDPNTGAIYLDSDFLWITNAERSDVSEAPDPRAAFGDVLQVRLPWRYVKDNGSFSITLNADGSRDLDQVVVIMAYLLYHELSHARDFMHPSRFAGLDNSQTAASYLTSGLNYLSTDFTNFNPLNSTVMDDLASVSFRGVTATSTQENFRPEDLISEYAPDGAIQYYAYTSQYEDFATLFETTMLSFHFGFQKDTAITNNTASSATGVVAWGQRGRLGAQQVLARAREVAQAMDLSNLADIEAHLNALPLPQQMRVGETWGQNLTQAPLNGVTPNQQESDGIRKTGGVDDFFERVWIR